MKKITVGDLLDYLQQVAPSEDTEVVLSMDDFGADADDERIDGAISLTTAFEVIRDHDVNRDEQLEG